MVLEAGGLVAQTALAGAGAWKKRGKGGRGGGGQGRRSQERKVYFCQAFCCDNSSLFKQYFGLRAAALVAAGLIGLQNSPTAYLPTGERHIITWGMEASIFESPHIHLGNLGVTTVTSYQDFVDISSFYTDKHELVQMRIAKNAYAKLRFTVC